MRVRFNGRVTAGEGLGYLADGTPYTVLRVRELDGDLAFEARVRGALAERVVREVKTGDVIVASAELRRSWDAQFTYLDLELVRLTRVVS